jgi:putative intracellular protease/amidase
MKKQPKVLIVVTSHGQLGTTGVKTGFWLEELAVPYLELTRAGAAVTIASPAGGRPPADPKSESKPNDEVRAFLADPVAARALAETVRIADATGPWDAIFVAGGHGVMWDLAVSPELAALLSRTYAAGGVIAAVCHGPAALVGATAPDGKPLVAGRRVAAFSNEEEAAAELTSVMPFLLESRLVELGGRYERGPLWQPYAVRDGRLVTGQNPASSRAVAQETLAALV